MIKKHILAWICLIILVLSNWQNVFAESSKIHPNIYKELEMLEEGSRLSVRLYLSAKIDVGKLQEKAADAGSYEERYQLAKSMYDQIMTDFLSAHYAEGTEHIIEQNDSELSLIVFANIDEIHRFAEDDLVLRLAYYDMVPEVEEEEIKLLLSSGGVVVVEMRAAAMAEILGYLDMSLYREAEREKIEEIIYLALSEINIAKTSAQINKIVTDTEERLSLIKTEEQLKAEKPEQPKPEEPNLEPEQVPEVPVPEDPIPKPEPVPEVPVPENPAPKPEQPESGQQLPETKPEQSESRPQLPETRPQQQESKELEFASEQTDSERTGSKSQQLESEQSEQELQKTKTEQQGLEQSESVQSDVEMSETDLSEIISLIGNGNKKEDDVRKRSMDIRWGAVVLAVAGMASLPVIVYIHKKRRR